MARRDSPGQSIEAARALLLELWDRSLNCERQHPNRSPVHEAISLTAFSSGKNRVESVSEAAHHRVEATQADREARFALERNRPRVLEKKLLLKPCADIARDGAIAHTTSAIRNHE